MIQINVEELRKYKKNSNSRLPCTAKYIKGWNDAIDTIIKNAPEVDTEPIKYGWWMHAPGDPYSYCSNCRTPHISESSYCPSCGAKMNSLRE